MLPLSKFIALRQAELRGEKPDVPPHAPDKHLQSNIQQIATELRKEPKMVSVDSESAGRIADVMKSSSGNGPKRQKLPASIAKQIAAIKRPRR